LHGRNVPGLYFLLFSTLTKGRESLEGYAERAGDARILVLPLKNFLHRGENLKFASPFFNSSILKSFKAYTLKVKH
jgi:hypothetical protein